MAKTTAEELAELKAQHAALEAAKAAADQRADRAEAEAKIQASAAAEAKRQAITAAIDEAAAQGRVTPAMRPEIEQAAQAFAGDPAALRSFLGKLPVQIRPSAVGVGGGNSPDPGRAGGADDQRVAHDFGATSTAVALAQQVKGVTIDGLALMADGSKRPLKDVLS